MTYEVYKKLAEETFAILYPESTERETVYEHITRVGASVMMDRDELIPGGGFVQAVNSNDLTSAVGRADAECVRYLKYFVYCKLHVRPRYIQYENA